MPIKTFRIDENSEYRFYESSTCNLISPVLHFGEMRQQINYDIDLIRIQSDTIYKGLSIKSRLELVSRLKNRTKQDWQDEYEKIIASPLSDDLTRLLQEKKKKVQQKIIKGLSFKTEMFMAIPLHAWYHYNMLYSKFIVDYLPKELNNKILPTMIHLEEENGEDFTVLGTTNMSAAEMGLAIKKRHRLVAEFIGDEDYWHCFFRTMSGIKGREMPHIGDPHLHYISSAWGIKRQNVINQLTSYRYSLRAETIAFDLPKWDKESIKSANNKIYDVEVNNQ